MESLALLIVGLYFFCLFTVSVGLIVKVIIVRYVITSLNKRTVLFLWMFEFTALSLFDMSVGFIIK